MGTETQIEMPNAGVQSNPNVKKKIVYNMYRDMLKTYNGRANEILETKPASCIREDRGISDLVESMARHTPGNHMSADHTNGIAGGAPPPPPPPLALGAVPALRLKAEINERRPEPPACVQNAMMTKDKKPFTYTPGGLDLSQIRSPRMAKRITRNAAAEGVGAAAPVPASPGAGYGPLPPSAMAAMQPHLSVQVFPTGGPPPPPPPPGFGAGPGPTGAPMPPPPPPAKAPSPPTSNNLPTYQRPDIKIPENPMGLLRKTGGPHRPAGPIIGQDEQLTKQPVINQPQMQPQMAPQVQPTVQSPVQQMQQMQQPIYKPVQPPVTMPQPIYKPVQPPVTVQPTYQAPMSPEQKAENRAQIGTLYIPPLNADELQKTPSGQKSAESPGSPLDTLKKAPTPSWLAGRGQQQRQEAPAWARSPPESAASSAPSSAPTTPATLATPATPATPGPPGMRVIPMRVEKTADAREQFNNQQQQKFQQQQQQFQQQQQQQYQQQQQQFQQQQQQQYQQQQLQYRQQMQQQQQYQQQQQQQQHVVRVIPIQIEGRSNSGPMSPTNNVGTPEVDGAPVQSPTFRILQRVTSRDEEIHSQPAIHHPPSLGHSFPVEQMRKMQMSNDDRSLMNRVKNQVDEDCSLHDEVDPRYRGPAIPSRAFRMLQTMTDAAEASGDPTCVPRAVIVTRGPSQAGVKRNQPKTPDGQGESSLPASEQRAPEPRKYTGSAIPSRSFQMLQAMVAPENCGPGQSDL